MRAFESLADSFSVPGAGQRHYSANRNEVVSTKPESVLTDCDLRGERVPMSQQNRSRIGVGGLGSKGSEMSKQKRRCIAMQNCQPRKNNNLISMYSFYILQTLVT